MPAYYYQPRSGRFGRSRWSGSSRKRYSWGIRLVLLVFAGILLWGGVRWVGSWFDSSPQTLAAAELQNLEGKTEFSIPSDDEDAPAWTSAYQGQKFYQGDSLRTSASGQSELRLAESTYAFVGPASSVTIAQLQYASNEHPRINLTLNNGALWLRLPDDRFRETKSSFVVTINDIQISSRGGAIAVDTSAQQTTVRVLHGEAIANWQGVGEVRVGVGQKLVLNASTRSDIANKLEVLAEIDGAFKQSEWNLQYFERFYPQQASNIRREIELKAANNQLQQVEEKLQLISQDLDPITFSAPAQGAVIPVSQDSVEITGTAPIEASQVVVNGYTLTRYQPGDSRWSYLAATKFGTLRPGENVYEVQALTRDGRQSEVAKLVIQYDAPPLPTTQKSDSAQLASNFTTNPTGFLAPTVTKPDLFRTGLKTLNTSATVVTLSGTVPTNTSRVEVNGFVLQKHQPGSGTWSYIANADYGNMKVGENIYEIKAFTSDERSSSTKISIIYTPPLSQ